MIGNSETVQPLNILLVDDEEIIHTALSPFLRDLGHTVYDAYDGAAALEMIGTNEYDIVLTDIQMPRMDGFTLLEKINEIQPDLAVVIITAHGDMEMVIRALRMGAADFLTKPVKLVEIEAVIAKALRVRKFKRQERRFRDTLSGIQNSAYNWRTEQRLIGERPAMEEVRDLIRSAVEVGCDTVLIQGETGTGKEVVAREIHLLGKKERSPLIAVSCPALPESLLESELFGHVKGSFTGAIADKAGCFELADGGTLFLDEVADLSPGAQAKLLRVMETRTLRRVGGKKEISVDVNVIAATNAPLGSLVEAKKFRQDLLYRLNLFSIDVPPLRERREDILPLSGYFLDSFLINKKLEVKGFSDDARDRLENYDYPGNARELRNIVERAAILCRQGMIEPRHLNISTEPAFAPAPCFPSDDEQENRMIIDALQKAKWNRSRTAENLGISYAALGYRMKKYDISD